jgi:predicted  nucleic acid-binding Zn-ribbon protein
MDQSTLNQVFSLFGKGVTQILQQLVNQQTVVDELRAQNRSLQAQVANLTASLDEVEDRIFVRLQNMQPTVFTREGIPIDDALDTLAGKLQMMNERLVTNTESVHKVDAEVAGKVDRDEFTAVTNDTQRMSEGFDDVMNSLSAIQKDIQRQRQDNADSQDRLTETIRLQVQSEVLHADMNGEDRDLSLFVTRDELNQELAKLRLLGGVSDDADGVGDDAELLLQRKAI